MPESLSQELIHLAIEVDRIARRLTGEEGRLTEEEFVTLKKAKHILNAHADAIGAIESRIEDWTKDTTYA